MQIDYEIDCRAVGRRLREVRKSKKYTQEKMAEKMGIYAKYLSSLERGVSKPSLPFIMKFSEINDVSLDYILKGEGSFHGLGEPDPYGTGRNLSKEDQSICRAVIETLTEKLREKNDRN